jgi:hypothetical protein
MAKFHDIGELYSAIVSGEHFDVSPETQALIKEKIQIRERQLREASQRIYEKVIAKVEGNIPKEPSNILEMKKPKTPQATKKSKAFMGIMALAAMTLIAVGLTYFNLQKPGDQNKLEVLQAGTKITQGDITYMTLKQVSLLREFKDNQLTLNIQAGSLAIDRAETGASQRTKTSLNITTPEGSLTLRGTKFLISTEKNTTQVFLLSGSAHWRGLRSNKEIPLTRKAPVLISGVQGEKQLSGKEALKAFSDYATVIPPDFKIEFDQGMASFAANISKPNEVMSVQGFSIGQCVSFSYANNLRSGKIVKIQDQVASIRMDQMVVDINIAELAGSGSCP